MLRNCMANSVRQWYVFFLLQKQVALGELMVSLGYLKSAERLTVVVIKARNLPAISMKGTGQSCVLTLHYRQQQRHIYRI